MNPDVAALLPLIAPVATLVIVVLGVFFSNHHVDSRFNALSSHIDTRIGDLSKTVDARIGSLDARFIDLSKNMDQRFSDMAKLITAESARLEAVLKLDIAVLATRVKALEDRESPIVRTRG